MLPLKISWYIIGGGSGHEPAFLGYVGKGLADGLTISNVLHLPS